MTEKPYSEPASRNAAPILEILKAVLSDASSVLEIGSGTGQHAAYFAPRLPHLTWQTSDREQYLPGIEQWVADQDSDNLKYPLMLDVLHSPTFATSTLPMKFDAVYSANTAHIMGVDAVRAMIKLVGQMLPPLGKFALYGPFKNGASFDAESNANFDRSLRQQDPVMGIRSLEFLDGLATQERLQRVARYAMPANNQMLIWQKDSI